MVFDNLGGRIASHLARHWSRYLMYGATTAVGVAAAALLHRVPPTRGRKVVGHLGFIAVAVAICMLAPHDYQDVIFSPAGAAVAGVFFPVLESMRAVCSVTEEDDRRWLQYWLAQASFMVATSNLEWLVLNLFKSEAVRDVWFHMQVLFLLWLQLPWTDGSTLLYDTITKPFILPRIKGIAGRVSDSSLINTAWAWAINGSHLYGLYFVFVLMPGVVEKFIVDMVGTAYPLLASTVAVTTEDDPEDDTQWLVYWCVFSLFHVFASIVDDALDWIPGFHSVTLIVTARCISVWLMLPFTKGADRVFRQILVPLFNMRADLIKKDAALLVKDLSTKLPEAKRASVSSDIAAMFGAAQPQPARSKSPATTKPGKSE